MKPVCRVTHRQLQRGTCPWCDCQIIEGHAAADSDDTGQASDRVWNIDVLTADLEDQNRELRMATVNNFLSHGPSIDVAIPLLAKALNDSDDRVREHASQALSRLGHDLPHAQAVELESQVTSSNDELALRLLLVGHYFPGKRQSKAAETVRFDHILWLIENAAEFETTGSPFCVVLKRSDPDRYEQAQCLWLSKVQANPNNAKILANAASFFTLNDATLSEKLLKQGQGLEPENPYWAERLGRLYSLETRGKSQNDVTMAAKSFAAFEEAEKVRASQQVRDDPRIDKAQAVLSRLHALPALARSAFDASEFEQAANYASELLTLTNSTDLPEFFRNDGDAIHQGNLVLGRVALEMGDIDRAKRHLLASGRTKGSPSLCSFGPNMSLAKDLLERGEREVVLEYFELCSRFWESHADRLDAWAKETEEGKIPDFGANLRY